MKNKQNKDNEIMIIGQSNFRDRRGYFGIKRKDRRNHMYIIGKTGTGKSTMLENLIVQDMRNGEGLAVFDPHGDFIQHIITHVPEERKKDLVYFNVPDPNCPYGFNPLANIAPEKRPLAASGIIEAFKKIWEKTWGPRMENILRNTILTLLDQPRSSFADVRKLYFNPNFRKQAVSQVINPQVKEFWEEEFARYPIRYRTEAVNPVLNKIGAFLADPNLQRVLINPQRSFDPREVMDKGKILLVNLAKGRIGEDNTILLGAILVSRIGLAAISRADIPEEERRDFYLYLDEFQNFTTLSMANILSELRKYHLNMIMCHQYFSQIEPDVRDAVIGNVGTFIVFRIGSKDAEVLEKEFKLFWDKFTVHDMISLNNFSFYIKTMIDGKPTLPFSGNALPPLSYIQKIVAWLGNSWVVRLCSTAWQYFLKGRKKKPPENYA
jgi:hypothetical protein